MWRFRGKDRPAFAVAPAAGQESVWDYPRPPRLAADTREVVVRVGDVEILRTRRAIRMLETASPPTFYLPFADARDGVLQPCRSVGPTYCEWKGSAQYWSIVVDALRQSDVGAASLEAVAWSYAEPRAPYEAIAGHFSLYPGRVACFVDGERVTAQGGHFYGGWVTSEIVGPWKGKDGTSMW